MKFFNIFKKKKGNNQKNIIEVIKSLSDMLSSKPATENQITNTEQQLGLRFSKEYREYLAEFGIVKAHGIELTGISEAEYCNVVYLTKQERDLNPNISNNMYVIENTCIDGVIIWQDTQGFIYLTQYDSEPKKIAESLVDYILNRIK